MIARFGGDEFVVLCDDLAGDEAASAIARRLLDAVAEPIALATEEVFVTASIGIALATAGDTSETLLRHADAAMYRAKNDGRARAVVFEPDEHGSAVDALRTGTDLHRALERDELVVHYQPIVDLRTGRVIGFEALRALEPPRARAAPARRLHPARRGDRPDRADRRVGARDRVPPARALAGGARPRRARRAARDEREPLAPPARRSDAREDRRAHPRPRPAVDPNAVCLELTENALMQNAASATEALRALRDLGVHLSIDDFGTGYSSLSYLKRFPVEALKIDRSFIDGLGHEREDTSIVEAIVTLAHALGLTAVAEGLETPTQLEALRVIGCDYAQGYLLGRPLPAGAHRRQPRRRPHRLAREPGRNRLTEPQHARVRTRTWGAPKCAPGRINQVVDSAY